MNALEAARRVEAVLDEVRRSQQERHGWTHVEINVEVHAAAQRVVLHGEGRALFDELTRRGVVADWREPNVIRLAPVPFYNSFQDAWRFGEVLKECQS